MSCSINMRMLQAKTYHCFSCVFTGKSLCTEILVFFFYCKFHLFSYLLIYVFKFLAAPYSIWDLRSPTRDQTCTLCIRRWSLSHWTTRAVPEIVFFISILLTHRNISSENKIKITEEGRHVDDPSPPWIYRIATHVLQDMDLGSI